MKKNYTKEKKYRFKSYHTKDLILLYNYFINSLYQTKRVNLKINSVKEFEILFYKNFKRWIFKNEEKIYNVLENIFMSEIFLEKLNFKSHKETFDKLFKSQNQLDFIFYGVLFLIFTFFPHLRFSNETFYESFSKKVGL